MRVIGIAACGNFNCQREIVGYSRLFALTAVRLTVRLIEVRSIKYGSWTLSLTIRRSPRSGFVRAKTSGSSSSCCVPAFAI